MGDNNDSPLLRLAGYGNTQNDARFGFGRDTYNKSSAGYGQVVRYLLDPDVYGGQDDRAELMFAFRA